MPSNLPSLKHLQYPTQVVTPVYASPMRVAVNLDSSRAANAAPAPAYPDICFAVDEFDETHQHMVRAPSDPPLLVAKTTQHP